MEQQPELTTDPVEPTIEPVQPVIKSGLLRGLVFLGAFVAFQFVYGIAVVFALLPFYPEIGLANAEQITQTTGGKIAEVGGMIGILLLMFIFRKTLDRCSIVSLGFSFGTEARRDLFMGMLWGAGLISAVFGVLYFAGAITIKSVSFPVSSIVIYGLVFALVAIEEEAISRGYLITNFRASMNKYLALLATSVAFAAFHALNPNVSWIGLANILLAGMLLGIYYIHTKNLWFPIGIHFAWNFCQGVVYGSHVSGVDTDAILTCSYEGDLWLTGGEFGFEASLITTVLSCIAIVAIHLIYRRRAISAPS